ncbi:sacsin-like [Littorina saxatilis]|uniref:sacsin-like n=1 Tax=Littorina saxatilis TaxID=31220 RepID=UPI0038B4FF2D
MLKASQADSDPDEEVRSFKFPTLARQIHKVLRQYRADGQILKELIQNAEDAQASCVHIVIDKHIFNQNADPAALDHDPHLNFFKGPALCAYNDAEFTKDDWEGILMLQESIKEKDPFKVGRFGLGFKSVFHLTDRLVILSGNRILYMDPLKGDTNNCIYRKVDRVGDRELEAILHCLDGVCGVSRETFRAEHGRFAGTLFWFPLRQTASALSTSVYTAPDSVDSLVDSFRAEAPSLLLFLNYIQRVTISFLDDARVPQELFSVGVTPACWQSVRAKKHHFVQTIRSAQTALPLDGVWCITELEIETCDTLAHSPVVQPWLVVIYYAGQNDASHELAWLSEDLELSYRPYVGVAIPVTNQIPFQSQIFCFLPLPLDTRSPTGLPVHVHGYFAISENRRHLEWPDADQLRNHARLKAPLRWNCLLVEELLPVVYRQALLRSECFCIFKQCCCCSLQERTSPQNPSLFYNAWPDTTLVQDRWSSLLEPLYEALTRKPCFFSHTTGRWVLLSESTLQQFNVEVSEQVQNAVVKVYTLTQQHLVQLPGHVLQALQHFRLLSNVEVINTTRVKQLTAACLHSLSNTDKLHLLTYFCFCNDAESILLSQQLLPLADGSFGTFREKSSSPVYLCQPDLLQLFPNLQSEFCDCKLPRHLTEGLRRLARSGINTFTFLHKKTNDKICMISTFSVRRLQSLTVVLESGVLSLHILEGNDPRIPNLIRRNIEAQSSPRLSSLCSTDAWLKIVWGFLSSTEPWSLDLSAFYDTALLPKCESGGPHLSVQQNTFQLLPLNGVYVCRSIQGVPKLSVGLAASVQKLGVTVLEELPDYLKAHRKMLGELVQHPTNNGLLKALELVNKGSCHRQAVEAFNVTATPAEKLAIVELIANASDLKQAVPLLRSLKIFTSLEGEPEDGRPADYPATMPLKTNPAIVKPAKMYKHSLLQYTGSVAAVLKCDVAERTAEHLQVKSQLKLKSVLQHLHNVTVHFRDQEVLQYRSLLLAIFKRLNKYASYPMAIQTLKEERCILLESGEGLLCPRSFWIQRKPDDLDLKPYKYPLLKEMTEMRELLMNCGSSLEQTTSFLQSVLKEIEWSHNQCDSRHPLFERDMLLTKNIIDVLKRSKEARDGNTILPIVHHQASVMRFKPAKDCTVKPTSYQHTVGPSAAKQMSFVHPEISGDTAVALGAMLMKNRALTGLQGFTYFQGEDLTKRLHGLLKHSYTDGLSIPKELIQNADDAGATEVRFLLDERQNIGSRKNLFSETMASLQGPAVWAYNNAMFSDQDFENIVKLAGETKIEDVSKVGKFGLGFNSVYNLTDVPWFLSRNTMALFDPQRKYIGDASPGVRIDFSQPLNQDLLSNMDEQFQPFQNVFGCILKSDKQVLYNGTLFRFPLRTEEQALQSKIKQESYSETKRRTFLKLLLERAGNLLMFTQTVKKVLVYYLSGQCSDPREMQLLLTVSKTSRPLVLVPQVSLNNSTILQFLKHHWSQKSRIIKIQEDIQIDLKVTKEARNVCGVEEVDCSTKWRLAWASGSEKAADLALSHKHEGLIPLATVATRLDLSGLQTLHDSPPGFYTSSHLFCFLPLPEETVKVSSPVHVNGTFALNPSRRSLPTKTDDDVSTRTGVAFEAEFNSALFEDAVCNAYLFLLELVKSEAAMDVDFKRFFNLWPRSGDPSLMSSFYKSLVYTDNAVLPLPQTGLWVSVKKARFLQPSFRECDCGTIAFDALQQIYKGSLNLVDIPTDICRLMERLCPEKEFQSRLLTEHVFFTVAFFPNLQNEFWHPEHRDRLVLHALMKEDQQLNELIKKHPCIPCKGTSLLRKPSELIHPNRKVAALFALSDGRFPQDTGGRTDSIQNISFSSQNALEQLKKLGMITDELPHEMVKERARYVENLALENNQIETNILASKLIQYLASVSVISKTTRTVFDTYPKNVQEELSEIAFLPVWRKPADWTFPWFGDNIQVNPFTAAPVELYSDSLVYLAGCKVKLLDTNFLPKPTSSSLKNVLQSLGVVMSSNTSDGFIHMVADQLMTIAELHILEPAKHKGLAQTIASRVYCYFSDCLRIQENFASVQTQSHAQNTRMVRLLRSLFTVPDTSKTAAPCDTENQEQQYCNTRIVWTGAEFALPAQVAFMNTFDCSPYLFQLEQSMHQYKQFFVAVGVNAKAEATQVLDALHKIRRANDGMKLSDASIGLVSRLAQLLREIMKTGQQYTVKTSEIYLPDSHGILKLASSLCVDDCDSLSVSKGMNFVHDTIPVDTARSLGVNSKRRSDYLSISRPFGQREKLTNRIKRLLEGYTFDSSLFKELLQNADDAGATELKLIKDFRQLGTNTIVDKMEVLQGPALCVYNNKSFTEKDMQGIENLGEGSKQEDALKIGQYGVGFNAVYHITDTPSFWTSVDEERNVICVFDPNCQYVPNAGIVQPGVQFDDIDRIKTAYPDMFSGFLSTAVDMTQPGTLFRFPLRTEQMAQKSRIKNEAVTCNRINELLREFKQEMSMCLLFLNNLKKIGIYSVNSDGTLRQEYEVRMDVMDSGSSVNLLHFQRSLSQASKHVSALSLDPQKISAFEAVVFARLKDSESASEEWLTVHRVGFQDATRLSKTLLNQWGQKSLRLLPRGAVAVKLNESSQQHQIPRSISRTSQHKAFCVLPLPVNTNLPMHVNGNFALDHETRRSLWAEEDNRNDVRFEWNTAIVNHVIVPAYITALQRAKDVMFPGTGQVNEKEQAKKLQKYHSLFPQFNAASEDFWVRMMQEIYKVIAEKELPLFPVSCTGHSSLEWVPAVSTQGFPGYFSNLSAQLRRDYVALVVLSQGRSYSSTGEGVHKASIEAEELQTLLKTLNMKILEAPFDIYNNFRGSGVKAVQQVTTDAVLEFLRSAGQRIRNGCNVKDLPQVITDTPMQSATNLQKLLNFVCKDERFLSNLGGLPLCLRQSGLLCMFPYAEVEEKPIASRFCTLLPGSAEEFLHVNILKYFPVDRAAAVVQELSISLFARMLPHTLKDTQYRCGKPCVFDQQNVPQVWLQQVWAFIREQLERNIISGRGVQSSEKYLRELFDWNLIPVKIRHGVNEELFLYPLKLMHSVLYLSPVTHQTNSQLWTVLRTLPLPNLINEILWPSSVLQQLVASIDHPKALLQALVCCPASLTLSQKDARVVLDYFSNNLSTLDNACTDKAQLSEELRKLRLYPTVDGRLVSIDTSTPTLCLSAGIPHDGLMEWSQARRSPLCLLRWYLLPASLVEYLGLKCLSDVEFYSHYLLPSLKALPRRDILKHVTFLRNSFFSRNTFLFGSAEEKHLSDQLKVTEFIEVDEALHLAKEFYTPFEPIFKAMLYLRQFPPEPYSEYHWQEFMKAAGIIHEVTPDLFVQLAQQLEELSESVNPQNLFEHSKALVRRLFESEKQKQSGLLSLVKDIRFVFPFDIMTTEEGQKLARIEPPFCSGRLVSFSESCFHEQLHLVWSSSCVLHADFDPRRFFSTPQLSVVLNQLHMQEKAPKEKVFLHAKKVCSSLSKSSASETLQENIDLVLRVMVRLYKYLSNFDARELQELKQFSLIYDTENCQMLKPENVVLGSPVFEHIKGYIVPAPAMFKHYFALFKKLGAAECCSAKLFATLLLKIKAKTEDQPVHVEEMKIVIKAVKGLFRCIREGSEEETNFGVETLYLPTREKRLHDSSQLIFPDIALTGSLRELPDGTLLNLFIGFNAMEITVPFPAEEIARLPEKHQLKMLSDVVKQTVPDDVISMAAEGTHSKKISSSLSDVRFKDAVVRLTYHCHKQYNIKYDETKASEYAQKLANISVLQTQTLVTILKVQNKIVHGSKKQTTSFADNLRGNPLQSVVYLDVDACTSEENNEDDFLNTVCDAVAFVLDIPVDMRLLYQSLKSPGRANKLLDKHGIKQCDYSIATGLHAIDGPGEFIPLRDHENLDNSFTEFYVGEHVGFLVSDPLLDSNSDEDGSSIPVYIYAVVLGEVGDDPAFIPLLAKHYHVNLGPDWGEAKVPVTKLYKFDRKTATQDEQNAPIHTDRDKPQDMDSILREILRTMREAWQVCDKQDRRRVVHRLILTWHPHKNIGNESFCTQVTQAILHQEQQERRLTEDSDDEADDVDGQFRRQGFSFSPSFFAHTFARAREQRTCYGYGKSSSGVHHGAQAQGFRYTPSQPNPQPGEGRRWLRTAEADLAAARAAQGTSDRGRNWVCFQCHQAVEKALKAVLYCRDANSDGLQSHSLPQLARQTSDASLLQLAQKLESQIGPHTRMRYPDVVASPKVPADVYQDDDVCMALDVAEDVVEHVRRLIQR